MKIFVIHSTKLVERRQYMQKQLTSNNFDVEFITDHDPDSFTSQDNALFNHKELVISEMSVIRKHLACYEKICSNNLDYALILEDDATLAHDFEHKLNSYVKQLPEKWDFCFIGDGCNLHVPDFIIKKSDPNNNLFRKSNYHSGWGGAGASKCTDSYLISNKSAYKVLEYLDKDDYLISKEHDHLLNEIMLFKLLITYWAEPTIVTQESDNGIFKSSLDGGRHVRNHGIAEKNRRNIIEEIQLKQNETKLRRRVNASTPQKISAQQPIHMTQPVKPKLKSNRPLAGVRPMAAKLGAAAGKAKFSKFNF